MRANFGTELATSLSAYYHADLARLAYATHPDNDIDCDVSGRWKTCVARNFACDVPNVGKIQAGRDIGHQRTLTKNIVRWEEQHQDVAEPETSLR